MRLSKIDHVSVAVTNIEKARDFYGRILGLQQIPRPDFNFPGIWYKLGDVMIHIIKTAREPKNVDRADISAQDAHLAFRVESVEELENIIKKLEDEEIPWYELENAPSGLRQLFFKDPDGHMIEIVTPDPSNPHYESVYLKYYV
ncbi:VOC family protein [Thermoflavimicrobium dichotomicum]|uniref:Catechol 2,3-dioxygenase n=1 Tax=Thermoflavimicrobium dichotomicum TaxID=46223 RepID=A0A1I3JP14_9BACL|nr:VOC family protein [Thermoflavimicrobium dichotomicum]SFI61993.1 Catechol 2,3-dioxygenase [Thermoflavimicrobium dichotomicum]